jgi:hypothetical protein
MGATRNPGALGARPTALCKPRCHSEEPRRGDEESRSTWSAAHRPRNAAGSLATLGMTPLPVVRDLTPR